MDCLYIALLYIIIDTRQFFISFLLAVRLIFYSTPFVLGTSSPPVLSMAWRMASARALKADSELARLRTGKGIVGMLRSPVMVVLPSEDVYMQRNPGCDGKGIEDMRDHLRGQITDFFSLEA